MEASIIPVCYGVSRLYYHYRKITKENERRAHEDALICVVTAICIGTLGLYVHPFTSWTLVVVPTIFLLGFMLYEQIQYLYDKKKHKFVI